MDHTAAKAVADAEAEDPDEFRSTVERNSKGGWRHRIGTDGATDNPDYFCHAFEQFFAYADTRVRTLAQPIRAAWSKRALLRL